MAAAKGKPLGGTRPKKTIGGKLPTKRSINLVLVDENKIHPLKAVLGILLILALAFAFSKFLVYDRLVEASTAQNRVNQLQGTLDTTLASIKQYGEVETVYAHYTLENMTAAETGLVDRAQVVALISDIIRDQDNLFDMRVYNRNFHELLDKMREEGNPTLALRHFRQDVMTLGQEVANYREHVLSWNVSNNMLQVEATGKTLVAMNSIARHVEQSDIVDSCTLSTAKKDAYTMVITGLPTGVAGKFQIYLVQPPEPAEEEVTAQ